MVDRTLCIDLIRNSIYEISGLVDTVIGYVEIQLCCYQFCRVDVINVKIV